MTEIIYKELSYKIVGAIYETYNNLGYGHRERTYQRALSEEFKNRNIAFKKELYFPVKYKEKIVSKYFFDFLVEDKIIIELKVSNDLYQNDISQILAYLKTKNYHLGILAVFTKDGVKIKRIAN
ncbi:MAG: hypothetical protein US94_C0033G0013 [Berkelbacteria bacterium GW2011_GWB1_38_5]|uniref:GxxExxY protein n=1 Tax=Berkelbacteria bacterium GW2011_GWB1_38_5 TaxID=1618336 RepID=A0A0G0KDH5_9BACT|nr:MAG: hypothetical protein US94_C0033G0013 [Berkelbacteria bacterium GW2011_GWB1_38_5]